MKKNLSLFFFLSALVLYFFHSKAEQPQVNAVISLVASILGLGFSFLPILWLIELTNQKMYLISFAGLIAWIGGVVAVCLVYLHSIASDTFYYFALIAIVILLMLFLVLHLYQILNQLSKK